MESVFRRSVVILVALGLIVFLGCSTPSGRGGGGRAGDDSPDGDIPSDDGADGADGMSAGAVAFAANDCGDCHTAQSSNFSDSSIDDIVDTLLGEVPHAGGEFGDLNDQDVDDITDFLLDVMLGDDDLDGGGDDDADDDDADDDTDDDDADDEQSQAEAWFEQVWNDFDKNYSHFETKGVDWDAVRAQYAGQFQADSSLGEFTSRIAEMLAELRDLHVWLFDADGEVVEVYSRTAARNYPNFYPDGVQQMASFPLWHGWLDGNIAFISIETFDGDQWDGLRTGDVDDLFATYAGADAIVVDVRVNNGGNENVAQAFAGHLTETGYVYGYVKSKNSGTDHNDFSDFAEHRLEPAESGIFLKPVACLIGERNMSSAEWFVLMMLENPNDVTLIGERTRGSSGSPQEYSLDNGIKYYIPSWDAYHADQTTKIEDVGIDPSAGHLIAAEDSYTDDRDLVLEHALELLTP
ncbi:MAG: hypothetical protein GY842_03380 [bacterium]|nr:hypothetical protein [bacterium]